MVEAVESVEVWLCVVLVVDCAVELSVVLLDWAVSVAPVPVRVLPGSVLLIELVDEGEDVLPAVAEVPLVSAVLLVSVEDVVGEELLVVLWVSAEELVALCEPV